jgi:hypothetical protein
MATSKLNARRPASRGTDSRDVKPKTFPPHAHDPESYGSRWCKLCGKDEGDPLHNKPSKAVSVDIAPSPDAGEAITLRQQAMMIVVNDKPSHTEALEFLRGAKQLKRKIEDHWSRITRSVDDLKRNLLDLKRADLEPVESAIASLDTRVVAYVQTEQRRIREEEDRQRRANEEQARKDREKELADQEAEALRLEAQSPKLSAREQAFVDNYVFGLGTRGDGKRSAATAGFKNPHDTAAKLLATPKILDAIASKRAAIEIRTQAAAVKEQPLTVAAPSVESNLGRAAGTRMVTSYSCGDVDLDALFQAAILNPDLRRAFSPNTVYLNQQARALRESFESVYPGCSLVKSTTVAG